MSGGLAGVIGVSAGADVYAPTLAYLISALTAVCAVYAGTWIETKGRVDDVVGAVGVHGVSGFLGIIWVGIFAAGYPTGVNNVDSSIGGQLLGVATFVPLGFLSGWVSAWVLKKLNLLRVPPEVEIAGLDTVEYSPGIYLPESAGARHAGRARRDPRSEADPLILEEARRAGDRAREVGGNASDHQQRARLHPPQGGPQRRRHRRFHPRDNYKDCTGFMTFGPGSTYGDGGVGGTAGTWS